MRENLAGTITAGQTVVARYRRRRCSRLGERNLYSNEYALHAVAQPATSGVALQLSLAFCNASEHGVEALSIPRFYGGRLSPRDTLTEGWMGQVGRWGGGGGN